MSEIQLLQESLWHIKRLERENQEMHTKLRIYEGMMQLFQAYPNNGTPMSPSITWEIEKYLEADASKKQPAQEEKTVD